jgi:hypothetical protein
VKKGEDFCFTLCKPRTQNLADENILQKILGKLIKILNCPSAKRIGCPAAGKAVPECKLQLVLPSAAKAATKYTRLVEAVRCQLSAFRAQLSKETFFAFCKEVTDIESIPLIKNASDYPD